ncbi:hemin-degrading factor [Sphingobacterium sp. LRF_L2]|uniref:hemin-degrading factor n=1 Tax=Sphingobacterium sp. LRF_L2 TaxID=3369421 RepID=UPI003F5D81D9
MDKLSEKYHSLRQENPKLRIRDAAKELAVSEVELVAIGTQNIRLRAEFEQILNEIPKLGDVMALTRNEHAVHERKGIYSEPSFEGKIGLVANPDIDLRLFLFQWKFVFAVLEGERKSIQFFAKDGSAIHKIYLTDKSIVHEFDTIVKTFQYEDETTLQIETSTKQAIQQKKSMVAADITTFQNEWRALEDTHHFFSLIKKYDLGRVQALQLAPEGFAQRIDSTYLKALLAAVSTQQIPIMVFIGNSGCIQIHTGTITKLLQTGPWFNILDELFNMHLREDHIAEVWIVKKPTRDGLVTSVEVFDALGEMIVQFFGKRKPGIAESKTWREAITSVLPITT